MFTFKLFLSQSKGGILAKACDHINELRSANAQMGESMKDLERISVDNDMLRQQIEELKQENQILRSSLQQNGIVVHDINSTWQLQLNLNLWPLFVHLPFWK